MSDRSASAPGLRAPQRLLVVPPAAGAADLAPALRRVRAALPGAAVVLFAPAPLADLGDVDELVVDDALARFDPPRLPAALGRLAAARLDVALVFTGAGESAFEAAYLAYLAGVPVRAGFADEFGGGVLAPAVCPPPPGTPGPARHLFLLRALGLGPAGAAPAP